jgi:hypothetical protein
MTNTFWQISPLSKYDTEETGPMTEKKIMKSFSERISESGTNSSSIAAPKYLQIFQQRSL